MSEGEQVEASRRRRAGEGEQAETSEGERRRAGEGEHEHKRRRAGFLGFSGDCKRLGRGVDEIRWGRK